MIDEFGRPDWDTYFITMCFLVSQRSIDPHTKHGCIVVDKEHGVLSTGYNGPPRGSDDKAIPLTRPEKYPYLIHAEENAILNAARNGISLKGSIFYITGRPCDNCFRMIVGTGATKVVIGPVASACIGADSMKVINILNSRKDGNLGVEIVENAESLQIVDLLDKTTSYYIERSGKNHEKH
jgi:dCMP deaminase